MQTSYQIFKVFWKNIVLFIGSHQVKHNQQNIQYTNKVTPHTSLQQPNQTGISHPPVSVDLTRPGWGQTFSKYIEETRGQSEMIFGLKYLGRCCFIPPWNVTMLLAVCD